MKKIICALLAASLLFCFAGCNKNLGGDETTVVEKTFTWPEDAFFKDIPAPGGKIKNFNDSKNDKGYIYEISVDEIDYEEFCEYIAKLEGAGFGIYKSSPLSSLETEDVLPEKPADGIYNATWSGNRRGVYVAAFWYGDEYYEKYDLPKDSNVRLTFYTYNAFDID